MVLYLLLFEPLVMNLTTTNDSNQISIFNIFMEFFTLFEAKNDQKNELVWTELVDSSLCMMIANI